MDFNEQLKANQVLEICLKPDMAGDKYLSQIIAIASGFIILSMPTKENQPVSIRPETHIYCRVIIDSVPYIFTSWVIANHSAALTTHIALPQNFVKSQMREYVRAETRVPVSIEAPESKVPLTGFIIKDISGGGIGILADQPLELNIKYQLTFDIPEFGQIQTMAKVVRCSAVESGGLNIGLEFVDLPEKDRNKIMKYVFKIQAERRRQTLG